MNKFTHGPWKATKCAMRDGFTIGRDSIAEVGDVKRKVHGAGIQNIAQIGPNEADARLIAAAPELLEALIVAERAMQADTQGIDFVAAFAQVRAAIAKATKST